MKNPSANYTSIAVGVREGAVRAMAMHRATFNLKIMIMNNKVIKAFVCLIGVGILWLFTRVCVESAMFAPSGSGLEAFYGLSAIFLGIACVASVIAIIVAYVSND